MEMLSDVAGDRGALSFMSCNVRVVIFGASE